MIFRRSSSPQKKYRHNCRIFYHNINKKRDAAKLEFLSGSAASFADYFFFVVSVMFMKSMTRTVSP